MEVKLKIGDIVRVKAGHDKRRIMIVAEVGAERVTVLDGKTRTLEKAKKKNILHVKPIGQASQAIAMKILEGSVRDCDIRNEIQSFIQKNQTGGDNVKG